MKRRAVSLLLICILLVSLPLGCAVAPSASEKPVVIATIFPQYDFVRRIAGDRVELSMLCKPGSEVHGFDPSLSEMAKILNCDLLIYVGGETDEWVSELLEENGRHLNAVALVDLVDTVDEEHKEGMQGKAEDEPEADEHVWTGPENAIRIAEGITDALCELLPEEADAMRKNAAALIDELTLLDADYRALMQDAKRDTLVFAERFPFRYLCEELHLDYYAALPGCSSNEEVSLTTVSFLIDRVKELNLSGVFIIEFSDGRIANTIAESTGCEVWLLHSCHNVSKEDFDAGVTYIDLMRQNLSVLKKAVE